MVDSDSVTTGLADGCRVAMNSKSVIVCETGVLDSGSAMVVTNGCEPAVVDSDPLFGIVVGSSTVGQFDLHRFKIKTTSPVEFTLSRI